MPLFYIFYFFKKCFYTEVIKNFLVVFNYKIVFTIGNRTTSTDHKLTEISLSTNTSQRIIALTAYTVENITASKINKINIINYF